MFCHDVSRQVVSRQASHATFGRVLLRQVTLRCVKAGASSHVASGLV
jgi:hypothetical protein